MPPAKALRDRLDLDAYPGLEVEERGRQRIILSYSDLEVDIRCKPHSKPSGLVRVRSWVTVPVWYRQPAPEPFFHQSPAAPVSALQDLVEEHINRVSPLEMLAAILPPDERVIAWPLVLHLPGATKTLFETRAKEAGVDVATLVADLIESDAKETETT